MELSIRAPWLGLRSERHKHTGDSLRIPITHPIGSATELPERVALLAALRC